MNALGHGGGRSDMEEQFAHRARFGRGPVAVLILRNIFGDENGILADSAKTVGEFFGSVVSHVDYHLSSSLKHKSMVQHTKAQPFGRAL